MFCAVAFIATTLGVLVWLAQHSPETFVYATLFSCSIGLLGLMVVIFAAVMLFSVYTSDATDERSLNIAKCANLLLIGALMISIRCTRSRGPRGFSCLHDVHRGPVNVAVMRLMKVLDMATSKDCVIVVHGFAGKRLWMWPLANRLRRDFDVVSWSYFSFAGSVERHAERLSEYLVATASQNTNRNVHLVAHSMGSIVARAAISMAMPANLGRLVLLAPPNSGSPIARIASKGLGWACQPLADLSDAPSSYVNSMPTHVDPPTAVIAARYDLLVPLESAKLAGSRQHVLACLSPRPGER